MQRIDAQDGRPYNIHSALVESAGNNINSLIFGGKFDAENSKKKQVYEIMTGINTLTDSVTRLSFIPYYLKVTGMWRFYNDPL